MKKTFILPTKILQRFFCTSLEEDFTLDIDGMKKALPDIYWQLPLAAQSHNLLSLPTNKSDCVLHQSLRLKDKIFSETVLLLRDDEIEILYIQLLPLLPPTEILLNKNTADNFLKRYTLCIRAFIKNVEKLATINAITTIRTTVLNASLAEIFKQSGYVQQSEQSSNINLPIDQINLSFAVKGKY